MNMYEVTIEGKFEKNVRVEAESVDEAIDKANAMVSGHLELSNEEFIIDGNSGVIVQ